MAKPSVNRISSNKTIKNTLHNKNNFNTKIIFIVIAIVLFLIFFGYFFSQIKTITSGFHFVNDHEYYRIENDLERHNYFETVGLWYQNEFENNHRMRFLFYPLQILMVILIGPDAYAHSILSFLVLISTCVFFFIFLYYRSYNFFISLLFPLLTLVGDGFTVYWRLGLQENICMHIVAIVLGLKVIFLQQNLKKIYQDIIIGVLIVSVTMLKESFMVFYPFLVFAVVWLEYERESYKEVWNVLKNNLGIISGVTIAVVAQLLFLFLYVGTEGANGGGQGVDSNFDLKLFLATWIGSMGTNNLSLMTLISILSLSLFFIKKQNLHQNIFIFLFAFVSYLLIVVPQQFIYLKGGMVERYFLPHQMGYALLIATFFNLAYEQLKFNKFFGYALIAVFVAMGTNKIMSNTKSLIPQAKAFTMDGRNTKDFLEYIQGISNDKSKIIISGDFAYANEFIFSLKHYLRVKIKNDSIFLLQTKYKPNEAYDTFNKGQEDYMNSLFPSYIVRTEQLTNPSFNNKFDVIICMNNIENNFLYLNQSWFNPYTFNGYKKTAIGYHTIFSK